MTKLGSRKLHIYPKVTEMGSIIGHRIDYNVVGALRGQRHIPSLLHSRGGALRDDTKNGCVAD